MNDSENSLNDRLYNTWTKMFTNYSLTTMKWHYRDGRTVEELQNVNIAQFWGTAEGSKPRHILCIHRLLHLITIEDLVNAVVSSHHSK